MANGSDPRTAISTKTGGPLANNVSTNDRTIDGRFDRAGGSGKGKYKVDELVYPSDLLSNTAPYGYNYVVFFINVNEDTRARKGEKTEYVQDYDPRVVSAVKEADLNAIAAGAGVFGANAVAGGAIGAALRSNSALRGAVSGVGAAAVGASIATTLVGTQAAGFNRPQRRLRKAIMLHMPNEIKTQYSTAWGEVDLKNYMLGAQGAEAIGGAMKSLASFSSSNIAASFSQLGAAGAALALTLPNTDGLQAATGLAPNPKKEMLFNGVNFRQFAMNYQFFPRNQVEANKVLNIIQEFKYHMHPEFKDKKQFLYLFPSEFDIYFYHKDEENRNLNRITSCALVDMTVDYTPNGVFNTMEGGMPTQINITLTFKELAVLDKTTIERGY